MNGSLGALLQEALADEERRLELLEARLASLREQQAAPAPAASASDSTQAIWAALAVGPGRAPSAPAAAPEPAPPEDVAPEEEAAADAEDWAALASPERQPSEPSATAYAAAAAAVEDGSAPPATPDLDPRLEAARRLLLQSGQGLQELKTVLARVPGWDDASPAADEPTDEREERDDEFWSSQSAPVSDDDEAPPPEVPARDRPTRTRASDAAAFGLERAFRGEAPAPASGGEPGWARDLRERQERGIEVLGRVEELLLELGKTIATVLEAKSGHARGDAALEARAERAERECEALRRAVAERAARIARLEALVEQVMVSPAAPPAPAPALTPLTTPRGTRRASPAPGPSEALRRTLLGSPAQSTEASRRALAALEPIADEGDRARLRQSLAALGAQHAQLLDRLVRLLES
jgi:hypothetical protein